MKSGLTAFSLAALLTLGLGCGSVALAQSTTVPDAPTPQAVPRLPGAGGAGITPGKGAGVESSGSGSSSSDGAPSSSSAPPSTSAAKDEVQTKPPEMPEAGEGVEDIGFKITTTTNFVEVPVTVKDNKGKLVAGLTYRDFKVFENNTREPLAFYTVDPFPLSIAFVVDQGLTSDVMAKVNKSLDAIQGALTPYDELAVFTYSNGVHNQSGGFTGAQTSRVPYLLSMTRSAGTEMLVPITSGPMAGCSIRENGNCVDPNIQPGRSAGSGSGEMMIPKEIHTLNDAILAAAKELSTRPPGRRRIVYVISDGKEYGSKATYKEVIRYLQTNKVAVYGTAVGDSARWGEGYISRFHIPFTMYDNILSKYTLATGGTLDSENRVNGIEKSYAAIAEEARTQYTLGYYTHEAFIDAKYRKIDVRVERPGLEVIAKPGYYPSARDTK